MLNFHINYSKEKRTMSEATENLVLEHLRHIRGRVDLISDDMKEVKLRLSSLESSLSLVRREIIVGDETGARQQASIDRIVERLERIEHRLDLRHET
jgi:tetrahydromethanopterin S-methyltransferase subunit G